MLRPAVKRVVAREGAVDPAVLLGIEAAAEDDLDSRPSHLDEEEEHDHDDFTTFSVEIGEIDCPDSLAARIAGAVAAHGILRVKGSRRWRARTCVCWCRASASASATTTTASGGRASSAVPGWW